MEQREKKIEPKNKEEKETDINEKPIGDLLREQSDRSGLLKENEKILRLFSETEKIKTVLYAHFFSGKKRDSDYHLNFIALGDLSELDRKDMNNVAEIFRELLSLTSSEKVNKNEIAEMMNRHELAMSGILERMKDRKGFFVQYLGNTAQAAYYLGDIIKRQREEK